MKRLGRPLGVAMAWLAGLLVALPLSAAYHLTTPLASEVLRSEVNQNISKLIAGRLEIGRVSSFSPLTGHVTTEAVKLFDPNGNPVIEADQIQLRFHYADALRGELHFTEILLDGGTVRLLDPDGDNTPSFVDALQEANPTPSEDPSSSPITARVEGIQLRNVTVEGRLIDLTGIRAVDVSADAKIVTEPAFQLTFENASGTMVAPYSFRGVLEDASGGFSADESVGLELHARGHLDRGAGKPRDELEGRIELRRPPARQEAELQLEVRADPADARVLGELGFEWAELFKGPVRGTFALAGPPDQLQLKLDAETAGGPVRLSGTLSNTAGVSLDGQTEALELAQVVRGAPPIRLTATGSLAIAAGDSDMATPTFSVSSEPFAFGAVDVPALTASGTVLEDEIALESLVAPYAGGRLQAAGRVGFDGRAWLAVKGSIPELSRDSNVRRRIRGLQGGVTLDITLQTPPADGSLEQLQISGNVRLSHFSMGPIRASSLAVHGTLYGNPAQPRLDISAQGQGVYAYDNPLGTIDLDVAGSPLGYRSTLSTDLREGDKRRQVDLSALVEMPRPGAFRIQRSDAELQLDDVMWTGEVRNVFLTGRSIEVERVRLRHGEESISVQGTFGPSETDGTLEEHLEAQVSSVRIAHLRRLLGDSFPAIDGRLDGRVSAEGNVADPMFEIEGSLREGSFNGLTNIEAFLTGGYGQGRFDVTGQANLGTHGGLTLSADGYVDTQADDLVTAFINAIYDNTRFHATDLDLAALTLLLEDTNLRGQSITERLRATGAPAVTGHVSGDFTLNGPIQAPNLMGALSAPDLKLEGWPELDAQTTFSYEYGSLSAQVAIIDPEGPLMRAEGNLVLDLYQLLVNPKDVVASLATLPWDLSLETPQRRVERLPEPIRTRIPSLFDAVDVALEANARGGAFPTHIDLSAAGDWGTRLGSVLCGTTDRPSFESQLTIRGDRASVTGSAKLGEQPMLNFEASARTPIDEWIASATIPKLPEVGLKVEVPEGDASRFLGLCEVADGQLQGELVVSGLFGADPRLGLVGSTTNLTLAGTAPLDGTVSLAVRPGQASLETDLSWAGGERAKLVAQLPVRWGIQDTWPAFEEASAMRIEGQFERAPLAPFITWLPPVGAAGGRINGTFLVRGTPRSPRSRGEITIENGYVELSNVGQHLSQVEGRFRFENERVVIERLSARDVDGSTSASGEVQFDSFIPKSARLRLVADRFPIRQEGSVVASVDGAASLRAEITAEQTNVEVSLDELIATLPVAQSGTVQELAPHPDIRIAGTERRRPTRSGSPYPIQFTLDTQRPITVRRLAFEQRTITGEALDFEASVQARLQATVLGDVLAVRGSAYQIRGFYEVFEKQFDIERGRMDFGQIQSEPPSYNPNEQLDPILRFEVTHEISEISTVVTALIDGRLSDPQIVFRSDNEDCPEGPPVIAMLISGQCGASTASASDTRQFSAQTQNFINSIAVGVGAALLRQELGGGFLGNLVRGVAVEDVGYGTRYRAKFDLSFLIPSFLEGIIEGVSLEGVLTSPSDADAASISQGVLPGGVLEADFPANFFLRFQFDPVGFAGDVNWEP